jgi:hypothetical protein
MHADTRECSIWGRTRVLRAAKAELSAPTSPAGYVTDDSLMDSLPLNAKGKITHGIITYEFGVRFFSLSTVARKLGTYVD